MKMAEYQDYIKLLFDKYLLKILYIIEFGIMIATILCLTIFDKNNPMSCMIGGVGYAIMFFLAYIALKWILINVPPRLFVAKEIFKKDIEEIKEKHK